MPTVNIKAFSHKKSTVIENGGPKLPTAAQLELGEIAINFAKGYETLSIKNNNNEIVTFTNDNYWINKELAIAAALNDLNDRITSLALSDDYAAAAQGTPPLAGDTYETAISKLHKVIVDDELITSSALNDLNSRIDNLSLSEDYEATDIGYEPESGDTYEAAISKLHGAILENELTTSAALNDLNTRINTTSTALSDLNTRVSDIVVPEVVLSEEYEPSSLSNLDLFLEPGDSYETAFSKLEKTINDNENITSAALTDLDSRLNSQSLDDIPDGSTRRLVTDAEKTIWNNKSNFSGSYNDLSNKPTIPSAVTESTVSGWGFTKNGGTITGITMNGASKGTSGVVDLGTVITSETALSKGTTTGNGNAVTDISVSGHQITLTKGTTFLTSHQGIKTLKTDNTTAQSTSSNEAIAGSGTINLHKVAKTGTYDDLIGKPTIPAAQVQSDWNATSGMGVILNKPTIPTVNNATLTIQKNGTTVNTFTANASSNVTANIQVNELPTVSSSDNGKILQVVNGAWSLVMPTAIYSGTSAPDSNIGNNGDIYVQQ